MRRKHLDEAAAPPLIARGTEVEVVSRAERLSI